MNRLRRLIAVLRAAWVLFWKPESPTEATKPPSMPFDFEHDDYLSRLVKEQKFLDMLDGLSADNAAQLAVFLRTCIRQQQNFEAGQTEAAITVFEDLKSVFLRYAAAYRGGRE